MRAEECLGREGGVDQKNEEGEEKKKEKEEREKEGKRKKKKGGIYFMLWNIPFYSHVFEHKILQLVSHHLSPNQISQII